jgi:hypothetical protein
MKYNALAAQHSAFIQQGGLTDLKSTGSTWNGVAPDGSPLIMRDGGGQQFYSLELRLP